MLRGPQGTLYGKNTIGGAMKVVTRRPSQDPRALFQASVGDYNLLEVKAAVSGPITDIAGWRRGSLQHVPRRVRHQSGDG